MGDREGCGARTRVLKAAVSHRLACAAVAQICVQTVGWCWPTLRQAESLDPSSLERCSLSSPVSEAGSVSSCSAVSRGITCCLCVSCQAGIIEEMLEDTFEGLEDQEEMEEEAEMEIDKILFEITAGE